jgi:hypothetical protein
MTGSIGIRPVPAGHQRRQRALHDRLVSGIESRLETDGRDPGIGKISLGRQEKLLNLPGVRRVLLKLPDLQ